MNVGLNTVVEFLHTNGYEGIRPNPNASVSDEQYALLVKEFGQNMSSTEHKTTNLAAKIRKRGDRLRTRLNLLLLRLKYLKSIVLRL